MPLAMSKHIPIPKHGSIMPTCTAVLDVDGHHCISGKAHPHDRLENGESTQHLRSNLSCRVAATVVLHL
uniref:Uncharacterized protein n=1 Tax=Arundo donax TaxID=35708 RepID=A0A0A8YZ60_ARUDO